MSLFSLIKMCFSHKSRHSRMPCTNWEHVYLLFFQTKQDSRPKGQTPDFAITSDVITPCRIGGICSPLKCIGTKNSDLLIPYRILINNRS